MKKTYCLITCPKGKQKSIELLNKNESVIDAASEFSDWLHECRKNCSLVPKEDVKE